MSEGPKRHDDADRRFAQRLAEHYQPEPLSPQQRARFDAALRERIERRRRSGAFPTLALAAATAAAVAALAIGVWPSTTPAPDAGIAIAGAPDAGPAVAGPVEGWELDVLTVGADATLDDEAYLPDEYAMIGAAFLDGR